MVLMLGFQPFFVICLAYPFAYSVHSFALLLRSLLSFVFLFIFAYNFSLRERIISRYSTIMRTWVRTSTYSYILFDSIGQKTGTHRDQVRNTLAGS